MKSVFFSIAFGLCFFLSFSAQAADAKRFKKANVDLSLGYRVDQLDWNIGRDISGGSPNIFSELEWKDLNVWQIKLDGELELINHDFGHSTTIVIAEVGYGKIVSGDNQDSDYAGDNRTLEWSRSNNDAGDGNTLDLSAAFGLRFPFFNSRFSVTPLVGYAFNRQELTMSKGFQTVSDQTNYDLLFSSGGPSPLGAFSGLNSNYDANWWGQWLGLDVDFDFSPSLKVGAGLEYHWIDYFAEANWNLRDEFAHPVSFEHEAKGRGLVVDLALDYLFSENWALSFLGRYSDFETGAGTDRTYLDGGGTGLQRLNEVNWESYALMLGLSYQF